MTEGEFVPLLERPFGKVEKAIVAILTTLSIWWLISTGSAVLIVCMAIYVLLRTMDTKSLLWRSSAMGLIAGLLIWSGENSLSALLIAQLTMMVVELGEKIDELKKK